MRRFRFPLDDVLTVRRVEERQAERRLRQAQERLRQREDALAQLITQQQETMKGLRQLLADNASCEDILLTVRRLEALERQRTAAEAEVRLAQQEVDEQLRAYQECRRRRELLEDLRQKAWRQWLAEFLREEQSNADDRALRDFAVKSAEG
jgi:flagellar FliJ protein